MKITRIVTIIVMLAAAAAAGWFAASSRYSGMSAKTTAHVEKEEHHPGEEDEAKDAGHAGHDEHAAEGEEEGHEGHGHGAKPDPDAYCDEHKMLEAVDALCNPDLITALRPGKGVIVRLGTPEAAARAGVASVLPQKMATGGGPAFPALTVYSRNGVVQVAASTAGTVQRLLVDVGAAVVKGQVLAEIASADVSRARAELASAQSRFNLAVAALKREEELFARGISARQELDQVRADLEAATALLEEARQHVALYGGTKGGGGATLALRSPLTGIVAERSVVIGQSTSPETTLFTVVNLATMGIELSLPADRISLAKVGAPIEALFDGLEGERFTGRIVQIAPALDSQTRLLKVLAEVENPQQLLKSGLFGQVRLLGDLAGEGLEVPGNAVQMIDGKAFVFIERESDLFELRRVESGARRGTMVLVEDGLKADEKVVATQGFALKSEVLKSRLGASCADH